MNVFITAYINNKKSLFIRWYNIDFFNKNYFNKYNEYLKNTCKIYNQNPNKIIIKSEDKQISHYQSFSDLLTFGWDDILKYKIELKENLG